MVDNINPTSQFHPYQPETSTPQSERVAQTGLGGILSKLGIDQSKIGSLTNNANVRDTMTKARGLARDNGGLVLGGLAALAIGAGLMRRRTVR